MSFLMCSSVATCSDEFDLELVRSIGFPLSFDNNSSARVIVHMADAQIEVTPSTLL